MLGLILNPLKSSRVSHVLTKIFWGNKQTTVPPYPRQTSLKYRFIFSSVMSKFQVFDLQESLEFTSPNLFPQNVIFFNDISACALC